MMKTTKLRKFLARSYPIDKNYNSAIGKAAGCIVAF
jgi:hypothetical protein